MKDQQKIIADRILEIAGKTTETADKHTEIAGKASMGEVRSSRLYLASC